MEADRGVLVFRLAAVEAERLGGETMLLDIAPPHKGRHALTRRFPIGPVAGISPFNFPLNLAAHKVAPAIAAGCSIVLKPPSRDPPTMLLVTEIIDEAGLPEGAVSVLPMDRTLGDPLDPETDLGPMVDAAAVARTERWVAEAVADGAEILTGGTGEDLFFRPTVVVNA